MSHLFRIRMLLWLLISLALMAIIAFIAPQQIPVSLYKLSLITSAAWVAYWIDVGLFPYARPDSYLSLDKSCRYDGRRGCIKQADFPIVKGYSTIFAAAMLRRAIIVGGAMLAVGLGA
jgi:hypothetical protein